MIGSGESHCSPYIDRDDRPGTTSVRNVNADGIRRITRSESRIPPLQIHAPEEDDIGPVADLAERCGRVAAFLSRQNEPRDGRRCHAVEPSAQHVRDRGAFALRLARDVGREVHEGAPRTRQERGRGIQNVGDRASVTVDQRARRCVT